MRVTFLPKILILIAGSACMTAQAQQGIDPTQQVEWPLIALPGAPTATCPVAYPPPLGSASAGQPYLNTTTGAYSVCGATGWVSVGSVPPLIGNGSPSATCSSSVNLGNFYTDQVAGALYQCIGSSPAWSIVGGSGGTNALTINGAAPPVSASFASTNASKQVIAATASQLGPFLSALTGCGTATYAYVPADGQCEASSGGATPVGPAQAVQTANGSGGLNGSSQALVNPSTGQFQGTSYTGLGNLVVVCEGTSRMANSSQGGAGGNAIPGQDFCAQEVLQPQFLRQVTSTANLAVGGSTCSSILARIQGGELTAYAPNGTTRLKSVLFLEGFINDTRAGALAPTVEACVQTILNYVTNVANFSGATAGFTPLMITSYYDGTVTQSATTISCPQNACAVTLGSGGTTYSLGDINTTPTGAQFLVTAVSGGAVTAFQTLNSGQAVSVAAGITTTSSGSGTGFTVNVTAVASEPAQFDAARQELNDWIRAQPYQIHDWDQLLPPTQNSLSYAGTFNVFTVTAMSCTGGVIGICTATGTNSFSANNRAYMAGFTGSLAACLNGTMPYIQSANLSSSSFQFLSGCPASTFSGTAYAASGLTTANGYLHAGAVAITRFVKAANDRYGAGGIGTTYAPPLLRDVFNPLNNTTVINSCLTTGFNGSTTCPIPGTVNANGGGVSIGLFTFGTGAADSIRGLGNGVQWTSTAGGLQFTGTAGLSVIGGSVIACPAGVSCPPDTIGFLRSFTNVAKTAGGVVFGSGNINNSSTSTTWTQASTNDVTVTGARFFGGLSLPVGGPIITGGSGVTSAVCNIVAGFACNNTRGTIQIVGGTATTGTIATITFSAALSAAPQCFVTQNGGTSLFAVGNTAPSTTSFTVTAGITVIGATFNVNYQCLP